MGETVVDFVIKEHVLHIVEINVDDENGNTKYRVYHTSSYAIEEAIYKFEQTNDYNWKTNSKFSIGDFSWCIVSENFNLNNDKISSFEFVYNDISYSLCYNVSP